MNMKNTNKKFSTGFVSIEMALVMLIVLILVAVGVNRYTENLRKNSISENTSDLILMAATAKKKYGQSNEYASITTALAVKGQVIPKNLRDGTADTASNSFGGAITVAPATLTGADDAINITWPNVPKDQCSDIVVGIKDSARRIAVGGTDVKALDTKLNMATTETACEAGDTVTLNIYVGRS